MRLNVSDSSSKNDIKPQINIDIPDFFPSQNVCVYVCVCVCMCVCVGGGGGGGASDILTPHCQKWGHCRLSNDVHDY